MNSRSNERPVKIVLLGDYGIGKTCISIRFVKGTFADTCPTIGACYLTKKLVLNGQNYRYEIWDTSGNCRYAAITSLYYRNAEGALIVFDISNPSSFEKVKYWYEQLKNELEIENMPISLVANKVDLVENEGNQKDYESEFVLNTAEKFAKQNKLGFFKTSAKTGKGIGEAFEYLAVNLPNKEDLANENGNSNGNPNLRTENTVRLDRVEYMENKIRDTCCQTG